MYLDVFILQFITILVLNILSDWRKENGIERDFEKESTIDLVKHLRRFYGEARTTEGNRYNANTIRGIRSSIARHLKNNKRDVDILKGKEFEQANMVFEGYLKRNKAEGLDKTKHHETLSNADWAKLHDSIHLSTETPATLQNKVFVNIVTHFGRRGREGLTKLRKDTFTLSKDENGCEYFETAYKELTKNHQGLDPKDEEYQGIMFSEGDDRCPVASLKKYLSKLSPNSQLLFTQPRRKVHKDCDVWYTTNPIGHNTLGN